MPAALYCGSHVDYRIHRRHRPNGSPRRARRSTPTSARSSPGTSIPRPAVRSGSTTRPSSAGIRASEINGFDDLKRFGDVRGRVAARRPGAALDSARGWPASRSTSSRPAARPASPRGASRSTTSASTTSCSATRCPTSTFPKGSNWLMLGPSGPRRLRLAVEHLASTAAASASASTSIRAGSIKLIKKGWMEHLEAYKDHVHRSGDHDPAGRPRHQVHVHHAEAARVAGAAARVDGHDASGKMGITGIFSGGTEFTPQWNRFAHEELLDGAYMTPTYGNTLMGLAASAPSGPHNGYKITYYAPQPRAVIEVVDFDDSEQGRRLRRDRPREADDADQGVLRPRLPGARRRRARAAVRRSIPGTASAACGRSTNSPRRRRSACIDAPSIRDRRRVRDLTWTTSDAEHSRSPLGRAVRRASRSTRSSTSSTGEPIAQVSRANGGLVQRDMRKAQRARDALRDDPDRRSDRAGRARPASSTRTPTLPLGDGTQTPDEFVRAQSATHRPARAHVPRQHEEERLRARQHATTSSTSLTRGLDPRRAVPRLRRGARRADQLPGAEPGARAWCCRRTRPACTRCGCRSSRCRSAWCSSPARRSRGRRTAWPQAFFEAGIPREAISIYPGGPTSARPCSTAARRSLIFGGTADGRAVPGQPARAGARPRLLARSSSATTRSTSWEKYLDLMVDSVFINSGRGCINCSGIWAAAHTPGDRRRHRAAARPDPAAAARRSRGRRSPRSPCPASPRRSRSRSTPTCKRPASPT